MIFTGNVSSEGTGDCKERESERKRGESILSTQLVILFMVAFATFQHATFISSSFNDWIISQSEWIQNVRPRYLPLLKALTY